MHLENNEKIHLIRTTNVTYLNQRIRGKDGAERAALVLVWCKDGWRKSYASAGDVEETSDLLPVTFSQNMCCTANMKTLHPFKKFLISSPLKENRLARCIPSVADMGSSNEVDIGTLMGFCSTREKETHDTNKNIMGQLRPIWVVPPSRFFLEWKIPSGISRWSPPAFLVTLFGLCMAFESKWN